MTLYAQKLYIYPALFVHSDCFTKLVNHEKFTIYSSSAEFFSFPTVITKYLARIKKINIKKEDKLVVSHAFIKPFRPDYNFK